ncbi:UDP-N-acetylglucosamine 3-dehydrogenase [uncultured archaeon]|nr:UDP-N-acetylglucosamine 3-dehydrogenase [uncultured archaeon]
MKVGVIGVGVMGQNHVRVYSELPDVKLVGVADVNKEAASAIAKKYSTKAFTDYRELFKEKPDAVSIVVPTSMHKQVAIEAANAGINILVEKPVADTIENAQAIIDACRKNNVKLMVGHIERFNPVISAIKENIKDDKVVSINITRVGPLPPRIKDVGIVIDLAVHDIDLIRYLIGSDFKKVYGLTSKNFSEKEDVAILSFEMKNGVLAHITTDWLTPFKVREINISSTNKYIRGNLLEQKAVEYSCYKEDGSYITKDLKVPIGEPLKLELQSFIECVKKNSTPPVSGCDGLKALQIALDCIK